MFKIPGHDPFMTTIGKLNFFRWALETKILDYIEDHQEEIRTGYNVYLKETLQQQKKTSHNEGEEGKEAKEGEESSPSPSPSPSPSSTPSLSTSSSSLLSTPALRTTRRRMKQSPSSLSQLQVYTTPIVLDFH